MSPSLDGEPDSIDLSNIIFTPAPPDISSLPAPEGFIDIDGVKLLYALNNSPGKFHNNIPALNILGDIWNSSTFFSHDCLNNTATKQTHGSLVFWRMNARLGTFVNTGNTSYTIRPTWMSSRQSTPAGLSLAKSRGYLSSPNDTKNIEFTAIIRVASVKNRNEQATLKWRGGTHTTTEEQTLQGGSRFPYYTESEPSLFTFEKTHPTDRHNNVTFVAPYSATNYPRLSVGKWRGIKTIVYNINNNQGIHVEWWIDPDPIELSEIDGAPTGRFNNRWEKIAVYEEQQSDTPVWGGPESTLRVDMAERLDIAAFNIHEIIPPTNTSYIMSPENLAEAAEYQENTGMTYPKWVSQITETPIPNDPNMFVPQEEQIIEEQGSGFLNTLSSRSNFTKGPIIQSGELSNMIEKQIRSPDFVSIVNAVTGTDDNATRKCILIRRISIPKEPKPIMSRVDEICESMGPIPDLPPLPPPFEEDEGLPPEPEWPFDLDVYDTWHFGPELEGQEEEGQFDDEMFDPENFM